MICFLQEIQSITIATWTLRRGVRVNKLVSLDKLQLSIEFDPLGVLHTFDLAPHLSFA